MQFGSKVSLDKVDFQLPEPDPRSIALLKPAGSVPPVKVYIGAPTWAAGFDPGDLPSYVTLASAVELNVTFHAIPPKPVLEGWIRQVPESFRFCPKVPRSISHDEAWQTDVDAFSAAMRSFEGVLGSCFFQVPPEVAPSDFPALQMRVGALRMPMALEVRHPGFFLGRVLPEPLFDWMSSARVGVVVTDTPGRRDAVHGTLTTSRLVLRFMGDHDHPTTPKRLRAWAERIRWWGERGLQEAFVFLHQPENIGLPALLRHAYAAFGDMAVPPVAPRQVGLFR